MADNTNNDKRAYVPAQPTVAAYNSNGQEEADIPVVAAIPAPPEDSNGNNYYHQKPSSSSSQQPQQSQPQRPGRTVTTTTVTYTIPPPGVSASNAPSPTAPAGAGAPGGVQQQPAAAATVGGKCYNNLGRRSVPIQCPYCHVSTHTLARENVDGCTIALFVLLLFFFWPLCWLPFVCRDCKATVHSCQSCGRLIGETPACDDCCR